ncbi:MAG: hypothetical protein LWX51_18470, partial [Deltaproteobacteria bacterium]|nr:hypothetical protein [Deltaproteobacteria bacterium]
QTQIEEISTIKGGINILDLLNFFKDITLIITPIVSVLLLVKYISELRKLTLEHQKVKLEYEKLKNEFEKRTQIVVNATAEDIARYVVNPIVREIDKAERERLEMQFLFLRENLSKVMESQIIYDEGVAGVFPNRAAAMRYFKSEIERENSSVDFVGTSLLGSIDPHGENEERVAFYKLLQSKSKNGLRIRALLMHPAYGEFRERVEGREKGAVAKDIQKTLKYCLSVHDKKNNQPDSSKLIEFGDDKLLNRENIRLYPSVITSYTIFTTKSMLVNISTLHGPVYPNLTFIIKDTENENSLFKRYKADHFEEPWKSDLAIRFDNADEKNDVLKTLLEIDFSNDEYRFKEGKWPPTIPKGR